MLWRYMVVALLVFPIVSALEIVGPEKNVYSLNSNLSLEFRSFNDSRFAKQAQGCVFNLYGMNGEPIAVLNMINLSNALQVNLSSSTFSDAGEYSYLVQCNQAFLPGTLTISNSGKPTEGIFSAIWTVILPLFFAFILMLSCFSWGPEHEGIIPFLSIASLLFVVLAGASAIHLSYLFSFMSLSSDVAYFVWLALIIITVIFIYLLIWLIQRILEAKRKKNLERQNY